MGFDTNWDIEKYKSPFESEEHWELRKSFLLAHKSKYPEDQLICLAQVFFNLEFLGCRYPEETMDLVSKLSEGIADSFREKKQNKLQRTFVKASDAAGAKIKGQTNRVCMLSAVSKINFNSVTYGANSLQQVLASQTKPHAVKFVNQSVASNQQVSSNNDSKTEQKPVSYPQLSTSEGCNIERIPLNEVSEPSTYLHPDIDQKCTFDTTSTIYSFQTKNMEVLKPYCNQLIIMKTVGENFRDHGITILSRSLDRVNLPIEYDFIRRGMKTKDKWECNIRVLNTIIATATASSKAVSKKTATEVFLKALQKICFTLEEKVKFLTDGSTIDKNLKETPEISNINKNSIANKMMKTMGWKGGGLGRKEQGISEPVVVQERIHRSGLGSNLTPLQVIKEIKQRLKTYAQSDTKYDLLFSSDFTKEERSKLHQIAQSFHLKSRSYGAGVDRQLVVSKKIQSKDVLIQELKTCGGEDERYRLITPHLIP